MPLARGKKSIYKYDNKMGETNKTGVQILREDRLNKNVVYNVTLNICQNSTLKKVFKIKVCLAFRTWQSIM